MIKPGETLPNGAVLIAQKPDPDHGHLRILLAVVPTTGEYVTWETDTSDDTWWGHYFTRFDFAVADFNER